jgi:hypothetical protein
MNANDRWTALIVFSILSAAIAFGASIDIGEVEAYRTKNISVGVWVDSGEDLAGVNCRIEYDPDVLDFKSVRGSWRLQPEHVIESHSPTPGTINVVVYSPSAPVALLSRSGWVFSLDFKVKDDVGDMGMSPIVFASEIGGTPSLPASGLANLSGASVGHSRDDGSVDIQASARIWRIYN